MKTPDGGDCTVVYLPDEGITGNSHFMFREMNNDVIARMAPGLKNSTGVFEILFLYRRKIEERNDRQL